MDVPDHIRQSAARDKRGARMMPLAVRPSVMASSSPPTTPTGSKVSAASGPTAGSLEAAHATAPSKEPLPVLRTDPSGHGSHEQPRTGHAQDSAASAPVLRGPPTTPRTRKQSALRGLLGSLDVLAALALVLLAAAARNLPEGDVLRLVATLPALLLAPGYLLLQSVVRASAAGRERFVHIALAAGISPGVFGLLALSTAMMPGGFQAAQIVTVITVACILLATVALLRRWLQNALPEPAPTASA